MSLYMFINLLLITKALATCLEYDFSTCSNTALHPGLKHLKPGKLCAIEFHEQQAHLFWLQPEVPQYDEYNFRLANGNTQTEYSLFSKDKFHSSVVWRTREHMTKDPETLERKNIVKLHKRYEIASVLKFKGGEFTNLTYYQDKSDAEDYRLVLDELDTSPIPFTQKAYLLYDFHNESTRDTQNLIFFSYDHRKEYGFRPLQNADMLLFRNGQMTDILTPLRLLSFNKNRNRLYLSPERYMPDDATPISRLFSSKTNKSIKAAINNGIIYLYDTETVVYCRDFQTVDNFDIANDRTIYWADYGTIKFNEWIGCEAVRKRSTRLKGNLRAGSISSSILDNITITLTLILLAIIILFGVVFLLYIHTTNRPFNNIYNYERL